MLYCKGLSKYYYLFGIKFRVKLNPKHYNKVGIIFGPKEGIGNRIFGLINVINYFSPCEINIFWDDKEWVTAKFYDLFDVNLKTKINEYNDIKTFNDIIEEQDLVIEKPDVCLKTLEGKSLGLKYNSINNSVFIKYQKTFQYIKPNADLIRKINNNIPKNDFVALQIRNAPDWEDFGRNENLNLFISSMKKLDSNKIFYLSAMNNAISKELIRKYDGKVLELKNKDYKSMQDAVCDLFIMANASKAIYSFGSTFGELAFWFRTDMQDVTVVGNQKHWINKKHSKGRQKIKKLFYKIHDIVICKLIKNIKGLFIWK